MLGENEGNVIARSPCVSDAETLREMLQAERRDSIIKSSSVQHLLKKMKEGTFQSFGTFHMLDLCLHSCF